jgi:hypothetical protein
MSDGTASLDAMIAGLRKLPALAEQAAAEAAPLVQAAVRATAAAGTDPYGKVVAPEERRLAGRSSMRPAP